MADLLEVRVPDIGDFDEVDVVEVLVAAGDTLAAQDSLITLESDKASMEVPAPAAGTVREVAVEVGSKVGEGALIAVLELAAAAPAAEQNEPAADDKPAVEAATIATATARPQTDAAASYDFDVVVLGSGPGGYAAAFRAADLGQRVALIERYAKLGGVCLNVGCIPSKALLHAAAVIDEAADFAERGIRFGEPQIELDELRGWKDSIVGRLTGGLDQLARRRKVEVIHGSGQFSGPHALSVQGNEGRREVTFAHAIIAAGSRSSLIPGLPYGDPRVMDSTAALEIEEIPSRLLVIGGGIIGLEMAAVYAALGSRITVVELLDRLMAGTDRDLVRPLQKRLAARYDAIHLSTRVTAVVAKEEALVATLEGEDGAVEERFDRILVAVGRRANGDRIGAEKAGVEVDDGGFVRVDGQQRTNVSHVFAIGDVAGPPLLAHKATHEGKVAAEVAAGEKSGFEASVIPSVAYTDPEVAWVGLTEEEAKERGIAFAKGTFPWGASGRSLTLGRDEGLTKLLFDEEHGHLLGAGIVGPGAGDLIAEAALAIEMGSDAADLALTIHPHPTLSETLAFAAEAFEGTITDLYMPQRRRGKGRAAS